MPSRPRTTSQPARSRSRSRPDRLTTRQGGIMTSRGPAPRARRPASSRDSSPRPTRSRRRGTGRRTPRLGDPSIRGSPGRGHPASRAVRWRGTARRRSGPGALRRGRRRGRASGARSPATTRRRTNDPAPGALRRRRASIDCALPVVAARDAQHDVGRIDAGDDRAPRRGDARGNARPAPMSSRCSPGASAVRSMASCASPVRPMRMVSAATQPEMPANPA